MGRNITLKQIKNFNDKHLCTSNLIFQAVQEFKKSPIFVYCHIVYEIQYCFKDSFKDIEIIALAKIPVNIQIN